MELSTTVAVLTVGLGLLVILTVFVDAVMTTLTVSTAAGPLTGRVLPALWKVLLRVADGGRRRRGLLSLAGAGLLIATVLVWVGGLWGRLVAGFRRSRDGRAVLDRQAAGLWDVGYFSGMIVVTLGTGDFVAGSTGWRFVSAAASFSGLFLVTLAITYLVSVISAVVGRRALAIHVRGLGAAADDIVTRAWTGSGYSSMFEQQLIGLTPLVATAAEQHLAYPVLHYFHAPSSALSAPLSLARLNDALLVAGELTVADARPDPAAVDSLRHAVGQYLDAAGEVAWLPQCPAPPPPPLEPLERHGIPLIGPESRDRALERAAPRRTDLHRLVVSDGWSWGGQAEADQ